jgi:cation diffusion facilitator family transporter
MSSPVRFIQLSIAAAVATILLKGVAWWVTGSVGLLSDALESFVNLAGAGFALWMITLARTPPDRGHPYGHGKAEYFSTGFEGLLILGAAAAILAAGIMRLLHPQPLAALDVGLAVSAVATLINFLVARVLFKAARTHRSAALDADARHLMTDVWTSVGVIAGVGAVALTGWMWLDPALAIAVGANILREALRLVRFAADGLMDRALPGRDLARIVQVLEGFAPQGVAYANLKSRRAGHQRFMAVDILVPGDWTVAEGHAWLDRIEAALTGQLAGLHVVTHLEPRPEAGALKEFPAASPAVGRSPPCRPAR